MEGIKGKNKLMVMWWTSSTSRSPHAASWAVGTEGLAGVGVDRFPVIPSQGRLVRSEQEMDQSRLGTNHSGFLTICSQDPVTLKNK